MKVSTSPYGTRRAAISGQTTETAEVTTTKATIMEEAVKATSKPAGKATELVQSAKMIVLGARTPTVFRL